MNVTSLTHRPHPSVNFRKANTDSKPEPPSQSEDCWKGPVDHGGYLHITPTEKEKASHIPEGWKDEILYFPMTDRFHDGDPSNNLDVDRSKPYGFHGGDLKGLTEKLDYIKDLGATAIWLTPPTENTKVLNLPGRDIYGYHGYWVRDHYEVEPRQGNLDDVKKLVSEAHKRGMKVVLDVVLNHVGYDHPFAHDPAKHGWFHHNGDIHDWDDPFQRENGNLAGLPDLNQDNPETYEYLLENTRWWVNEMGFDGVRLDAIKHVNIDFWRKFIPDLKERTGKDDLFVVGEVFHGDPAFQAAYQHAGVDSLFDFPLYYTIRDAFGRGASARRLANHFEQDRHYKDPDALVTFIDNHDIPRFVNNTNGHGRQRLKNALAFITAARGIPMLYYGTEVAMEGGEDPDNRRDMQFGKDPELTGYVTRLNNLRTSTPALKYGEQLEMWQDEDVFAFARRHEGQEVISAFNVRDWGQKRRIPLREGSPLSDGTVLKDQLSDRTYTVKDGHIEIDLPERTAAILVPQS